MSFIEELKIKYAEQDNRATRFPIFVRAQELVSIGVIESGYSVNCPYGDGVTRIEYRHEEFDDTFESYKEAVQAINENYEGDIPAIYEACEEICAINVGYIWVDRQFFLTIEGAKQFLELNAHNMGKTRTYVDYFPDRNVEIRTLLKELGFKGTFKFCKQVTCWKCENLKTSPGGISAVCSNGVETSL